MHKQHVDDADVLGALPVLQSLIWADSETRRKLHGHGINVVPAHFYSAIPTAEEIDSSFEYQKDSPPYLEAALFDDAAMRDELRRITAYAPEFAPAVEGDESCCREFFWKNSMFSYSDAMAYYCFVRHYRPETVVEIGSGFSTLVAAEAIRRNGRGRVVCVEPFPRPFLRDYPGVTLVDRKAQDIDPETLNGWLAADGDVLFIDSTHTVKTGSDCVHIYLRLLPNLKRRVLAHAHDIFLPHGMPKSWLLDHHFYWTEQYLLFALLLDNPRAKVLYGSAYHETMNRPLLDRMMGGKYGSGGGSLWFSFSGRTPGARAASAA